MTNVKAQIQNKNPAFHLNVQLVIGEQALALHRRIELLMIPQLDVGRSMFIGP